MDKLLRVLVVDDSQISCEALKAELESYDVDLVDTCFSGERAVALLGQVKSHYDAIFVDLHMPGMDGIELIRHLNQIRFRGGVIIVSSLDKTIVEHTSEVVRKFQLHLLGSLSKPYDRNIVAFIVRRIRAQKPIELDELPVPKRLVREAIAKKRIEPYFQPLIDGTNNSLLGLEALSRIKDVGGNALLPAQFLPTIEKFSLFNEFMPVFLEVTLRHYKKICSRLKIDAPLRINLNISQIEDDALPDLLSRFAEREGVPSSRITIEIGEQLNLTEVQLSNIGRLKIAGFGLCLDDYGSGYTNIRQLQLLPIDDIKIDRQLVNSMHRDKALRTIIEAVKQVADDQQIRVIANGVHDPSDLIMLDKLGVNFYQGHFFSRPKPVNDCIRWLKSWRRTLSDTARHDSVTLAE